MAKAQVKVKEKQIPRLTKEQAAIIGAYTGIVCGPFADIHEYAEKKFGNPIFTHEFGITENAERLKDVSREDFMALCHDPKEATNEDHTLAKG